MVNAQLMELMKKIIANPEYKEKFAKCETNQEMFDYCSSICSGYTQEEFDAFLSEILKEANSQKSVSVSAQNLEDVSGGGVSDAENWISNRTFEELSGKFGTASDIMFIVSEISKMFNKNLEQNTVKDMFKNSLNSVSNNDYH